MSHKPSPPAENATSWTLIHAAADGSKSALDQFGQRYEQAVRNCLAARWNRSPRISLIDDAVQEVFIECIRPGGALSKANSQYPGGFRAFLFGVMRNVMLRFESKPLPGFAEVPDVVGDDGTVGEIFDREYAQLIVKEASVRQQENAQSQGDAAVRRVELLHLRFYDGLPIREIANRWSVDSAWLHRQYAKAREEFLAALLEVVAASQPSATDAENLATCKELLGML
ncbi:MAG: sigma-70 family RNA polymerase sigma factor [Pirellulaceae bacterium]|nr:sigma-70 family RNA polymerase sigma factor [Pirellulaceae bacterium]